MVVRSVNVGRVEALAFEGDVVCSGIFKRPVDGAVCLTRMGFRGDSQADTRNHGGPDKAVCVYSFDHYPYWEKRLGRGLEPGAFGENLTVSGVREESVCIGDVFRVGGALVQVSQPRQPCHKLGKKMGDPEFPDWVIEAGFTGFYFRVLEEGPVGAGDRMEGVEKDPGECSVGFANRVMYHDRDDREGLRRLLRVDALANAWRRPFAARLRR